MNFNTFCGKHASSRTWNIHTLFKSSTLAWKEDATLAILLRARSASQPDELRSTLRVRQTARNVLRLYIPYLVLTYAPNGSMRQRYPRGTALPMANIVSY